jgi:hypothetical protein
MSKSSKISTEKLAAMSKEDKLKLYDLIQKKKEFQKNKRESFRPNTAQLPVVKSSKKIRFFAGGNGSGKTTLAVNEVIWAAEGINPVTNVFTRVPSNNVVVLDNPTKVENVWKKELGKWYNLEKIQQNKHGHPYVTEWVFENGSRVQFIFHAQEMLVVEGIEADGLIIYDEPPPRQVFIGLSRGQRTKNSNPRTLIIGTPLAQSWLRQEIWEPWEKGENPDIECFRGSTEQNKANLAEGYIDSFSRLLTESEKRVRLHGEFWDIGGLALAHLFKESVHIIEDFSVPNDWPCIVAIDPHPQKKHVAIMLAIDPRTSRKYVVKEVAEKMVAADFAEMLLNWARGYRVIDWVSDSLGAADMTGGDGFKSFIQVLNDFGIRVRSTTYEEKGDDLWIERIRSALAIPKESDNFGEVIPALRIFRTCDRIVKDIQNVAWLRYKNLEENKPKLDISNKDYLATLKYALAAAAGIKPRGQEARAVKLGSKRSGVSIRERYMRRG